MGVCMRKGREGEKKREQKPKWHISMLETRTHRATDLSFYPHNMEHTEVKSKVNEEL